MISLILALLVSSSAHAGVVIAKISLDLDGDSKPDTVRVVQYKKRWNSVEVAFTSTGKVQSFDRLLLALPKKGESPCGHREDEMEVLLKALPGEGFELTETTNGIGSCQRVYEMNLRVGVQSTRMEIEKASLTTGWWSMGDDAPMTTVDYDFLNGIETRTEVDMHAGSVPDVKTRKMELGCSITLEDYNRSGLPACAVNE